MLIKTADDKTRRLTLLQELQKSPLLDARQKDWLREELRRLRTGMEGERDAAHYLDAKFKDSSTHAMLHDLRISVDGEVAQIDHLLVNRGLMFFLFETKCFNSELHINDRGEFTLTYPGERQFGIPSPIEQSRRHERILAKLLERLGITGRMGTRPQFVHVVMLHPKAIIHRPPSKEFDTDCVIKADQIGTWHAQFVDQQLGGVRLLNVALNLRSEDDLRGLAEKLARQHRPADQLTLPDFMAPQPARAAKPAQAPSRSRPVDGPQAFQAPTAKASPSAPATQPPPEELRRKLVCVACRQKISFAEGKYCWNNEDRFGGFQYCREDQAKLAR
jgi:hypothetical protein